MNGTAKAYVWRGLRLGWTVGCGSATVLVLTLWARSYWWADGAGYGRPSTSFTISSQNGVLTISKLYDPNGNFIGSRAVDEPLDGRELLCVNWWDERPQLVALVFPHWLLALVLASAGALAWAPRRFTMRTLLVLMTAIALLVGMLAYFSRS